MLSCAPEWMKSNEYPLYAHSSYILPVTYLSIPLTQCHTIIFVNNKLIGNVTQNLIHRHIVSIYFRIYIELVLILDLKGPKDVLTRIYHSLISYVSSLRPSWLDLRWWLIWKHVPYYFPHTEGIWIDVPSLLVTQGRVRHLSRIIEIPQRIFSTEPMKYLRSLWTHITVIGSSLATGKETNVTRSPSQQYPNEIDTSDISLLQSSQRAGIPYFSHK